MWSAPGGRVGMCNCYDRRWPREYRVLGLQGVELITLGCNTPMSCPAISHVDYLTTFHNHLVMQANAYANGAWVAAARGGTEESVSQPAQDCIIAPSGERDRRYGRIGLDSCNIHKRYIC